MMITPAQMLVFENYPSCWYSQQLLRDMSPLQKRRAFAFANEALVASTDLIEEMEETWVEKSELDEAEENYDEALKERDDQREQTLQLIADIETIMGQIDEYAGDLKAGISDDDDEVSIAKTLEEFVERLHAATVDAAK